ncbi:alpha/beta fold hydrolase [Ensifer sp. Root127]|uniref:alpha/beta fold hydrolase n=1 Tax=Ensifer sp. Root127 TaxID=1736440 RepID=UPI00070ED2C1|nr:alpha/beta fold hydrolase [Ensifer sp. Root127]KQW72403.1 alpha/beta hydrolase [Ensifer sp. Root127]
MESRLTTVFVPGLLCDDKIWAHQAQELGDIVAPVIADLTKDNSIAGMADRLAAGMPETFVIIALSMGGYVAFELLRTMPRRIAAVALIDTSASPDTSKKAAERRAGIASLNSGRFSGVTNRLLPRLIHNRHVDGPVGVEVKAMAQRVGGEAYIRQQSAILERSDFRSLLPEICVPTLVAVGAQDLVTPPKEAQKIHASIAQARFHVFEDCGHLPPLEAATETTSVLRAWLTDDVLPSKR